MPRKIQELKDVFGGITQAGRRAVVSVSKTGIGGSINSFKQRMNEIKNIYNQRNKKNYLGNT